MPASLHASRFGKEELVDLFHNDVTSQNDMARKRSAAERKEAADRAEEEKRKKEHDEFERMKQEMKQLEEEFHKEQKEHKGLQQQFESCETSLLNLQEKYATSERFIPQPLSEAWDQRRVLLKNCADGNLVYHRLVDSDWTHEKVHRLLLGPSENASEAHVWQLGKVQYGPDSPWLLMRLNKTTTGSPNAMQQKDTVLDAGFERDGNKEHVSAGWQDYGRATWGVKDIHKYCWIIESDHDPYGMQNCIKLKRPGTGAYLCKGPSYQSMAFDLDRTVTGWGPESRPRMFQLVLCDEKGIPSP